MNEAEFIEGVSRLTGHKVDSVPNASSWWEDDELDFIRSAVILKKNTQWLRVLLTNGKRHNCESDGGNPWYSALTKFKDVAAVWDAERRLIGVRAYVKLTAFIEKVDFVQYDKLDIIESVLDAHPTCLSISAADLDPGGDGKMKVIWEKQ